MSFIAPTQEAHYNKLMHSIIEPIPEIMNNLTPKQRRIAALLASGVTNNKVIGQLLNTRPGTIKAHVSQMSDKLRLSGRTQLAVYLLTGYRPE